MVDVEIENLEESAKKKGFNLTFSNTQGILRPPVPSQNKVVEQTPLKRIAANLTKNDENDDIDVEWAQTPWRT